MEQSYQIPNTRYPHKISSDKHFPEMHDDLRILYKEKYSEDTSSRIQFLVKHLREVGAIY